MLHLCLQNELPMLPVCSQAQLHSFTLWWEMSLPEHKRRNMQSSLQLNALKPRAIKPEQGQLRTNCRTGYPLLYHVDPVSAKNPNIQNMTQMVNACSSSQDPQVHMLFLLFCSCKNIVWFFMQESTHYMHYSTKLEKDLLFLEQVVFSLAKSR